MQIIYTGQTLSDSDFLGQALIAGGVFDPDVVSASATQLQLNNPFTGWTTTVNGTGFAFNSNQEPIGGTITDFTITNGQTTIAQISDVSWNLVQFVQAMDAAVDTDNFTPLSNLINQASSITVDASGSFGGFEIRQAFNEALYQINTPMTVTGSTDRDSLEGGLGDDTINPGGSSPEGGNILTATPGNDTYDFDGNGDQNWIYIGYGRFDGITATIGSGGVTGTVTDGTFTDTFLNTDQTPWGLSIDGTRGNDVFNINTDFEDTHLWRGFSGGAGADIFNITMANGTTRLDYHSGGWEDANQGLVINLDAGIASNDGFGFTDTINLTYGDGRLSVQGTDFADMMIGGAGRDEFITRQGNDTVDGGDGFDRLRYDRSGVEAVTVDLFTGTATGIWDGQAFTDTFTNIESVRGSREGADMLVGGIFGDHFEGRGGNDTINGRGGHDTLHGQDGNDLLLGAFGFDTLYGGAGEDTLNGGQNADQVHGGTGNDRVIGSSGTDQLFGDEGNDTLFGGTEADRLMGGADDDVLYGGSNFGFTADRLFGDEGNDTLYGQSGFDRLEGGEGDDYLDGGAQADNLFGGAGNDTLLGSGGLDRLFGDAGDDMASGGDGNDGLFGLMGDDTLNGDAGNDRFFGGIGNDLIFGGADNDTVHGGAGFDTIEGGTGDDLMWGRFNADFFIFADGHGNDTIADFNASNAFEHINLSGVTALSSLADLDLSSATNGAATQVGANVVIDTGAGSSITLTNMLVGDLNANDFVF